MHFQINIYSLGMTRISIPSLTTFEIHKKNPNLICVSQLLLLNLVEHFSMNRIEQFDPS